MQNDVSERKGGKFVKGQSGNPAGRPKGRRNKITKLNDKLELAVRQSIKPQQVSDVLQELYVMATSGVAGAASAAKTFLEYTLVKPKEQTEQGKGDIAPTIRIVVENHTHGAEKPIEGVVIENQEQEAS